MVGVMTHGTQATYATRYVIAGVERQGWWSSDPPPAEATGAASSKCTGHHGPMFEPWPAAVRCRTLQGMKQQRPS